jgi:RNA-directed DNA polymerase
MGGQKSECLTVPEKSGNLPQGTRRRERGAGNMDPQEGKMDGISGPETISARLRRIAELAREDRGRVLTSLNHHIDEEWLREAHRRTRKDGAPGIDGVTAAEYEENVEENLRDLHDRFKQGSYYAPPVRRVHIPKGDGNKTRPIGVPTYEDKVLQRAVVMVLTAVYEQDFMDCSYGFRPGRGCHDALQALWQSLMKSGGGWVLDLDIQDFFGTLVPGHLRDFLDRRVRDGVIRRCINKWLRAGVMEEGRESHPDRGTPQGGVISPLLANIYLHEVLDSWFDGEVKPRLQGRATLVRYADDAVMVFTSFNDAQRVLDVLPRRLGRFGLTLHPEKTRLLPFRRPGRDGADGKDPGSFDFLGFTHYWGLSRNGRRVVKRKTAKSRFGGALKRVAQWCRQHRHLRVREQHAILCKKITGHDNYYGLPENRKALAGFRYQVVHIWRKWLARRSQRGRMPWVRFLAILKSFPIPAPRCIDYGSRLAANPCS